MSFHLVIGTPRSGTSIVAGVLHHLGVYMGDDFLTGIPDWHPKGNFTSAAWERLLQSFSPGWFPSGSEVLTDEQRDKLRELLADLPPLSGAKCTKLSAIWQEIAAIQPDCKAIVTQRNPERSHASYLARTNGDPETLTRWIQGATEGVQAFVTESTIPMLVVDFDTAIDDAAVTVKRIAEFVGVDVTSAALDFIDPTARRF